MHEFLYVRYDNLETNCTICWFNFKNPWIYDLVLGLARHICVRHYLPFLCKLSFQWS